MAAPSWNPHVIYQDKMNRLSLYSPWPPSFAFITAAVSLYLVSSLSPALNCKLFKGRKCCEHICNSYNAVVIILCADYTGYWNILSDILGVSVRVFLDEIIFEWVNGVKQIDHPPSDGSLRDGATWGLRGLPSLWSCERICFCCLNHQVLGILLWQPEKTKTVPSAVFLQRKIIFVE